MRKLFFAIGLASVVVSCDPAKKATGNNNSNSQLDQLINPTEVERIEQVLAADDMQGREAGTPGADKAAAFIASEFRNIGLEYMPGLTTYQQDFLMYQPKHVSTSATINGEQALAANVIVVTQQPDITINEASGYEKVTIKAGQKLFQEANRYVSSGKNMVIVVDTAHRKNFSRLTGFRRPAFSSSASQVFVLSATDPGTFSVTAKHDIAPIKLSNVVGVLPGKSKKDEYVVFSGHHDHIGIGKPTAEGDSIYNGANDDAAGTTAVIMLAKYFRAMKNNERTLVFVTFTAEEIGGYGSQYFSKQLNPDKVMAMFNIEMIGTESKWGANSAYITGFEKSDMGAILQKNLEGTGFTFHPDPYPDQQLFLRSDNATLARLGVPAHTISTSKMDVEKYYHTADDEIGTLDMKNMAAIIRAIALSSRGIVSGTETPSRVKN